MFDNYLAVQTGTLLADRYRLISEEREGNGGRLFRATDEQNPTNQPAEVGIKLLHPAIAADPALLDLLENELGVIRQAAHPHLIRYYRLERPSQGACIVREWVHGFALYDLLRWRHSLIPVEMRVPCLIHWPRPSISLPVKDWGLLMSVFEKSWLCARPASRHLRL